jgi:hypothetical protein
MQILSYIQPEVAAEIHVRMAQKKLLQAQLYMDANNSDQLESILEQVQLMVNRSLNLTKHAQTKGINTITIEQLISNVSE